ncbi:DoxX family protein [Kribbella sp. NPDC023855]|uniref:DoxX family protein n=1 Tax=Kribbella sp. NPDC023855 TaxID=3154698 RepID=UPI0033FC7F99
MDRHRTEQPPQEDEMTTIGTTTTTTKKVQLSAVGLWILQLSLAVEFLMAGVMKLTGNAVMVEMFAEIGAGQWLRFLVGALEVAGAVGVLIPRLTGLAALGLTLLMGGAVITTAFVLGASPAVPLAILVIAGLVAWFRRFSTRALIARFAGEVG